MCWLVPDAAVAEELSAMTSPTLPLDIGDRQRRSMIVTFA